MAMKAPKGYNTKVNRDGNYLGTVDFNPLKYNSTNGSAIGSMGTNKFEGGLKKGAAGIPNIKKSK